MAKCDLSIELDEPDRLFPGGGNVSGVVRVHVDTDVNCNGLEVKSVWRSHGRGNIDTGETASKVLFAGQWRAGENPEYRFELPIADWPPSYHGFYLNVDHYIDARAKIPWSFDPKASAPLMMRPTCRPEDANVKKNVIEVKGFVGVIVVLVFVLMTIPFFFLLLSFGILGLIGLLLPIGGGIYWAAKYGLPKYLLGDVQYQVSPEQLSPGESVSGELVIRPRKQVPINAITLDLEAREQCVSGSGSNRTTHKHVFFQLPNQLQGSTTLQPGNEHRFAFQFDLPSDAPYTLDLDDNSLIWSAKLRIDIPRWPDWAKTIPLVVVPSEEPVAEGTPSPRGASPMASAPTASVPPAAEDAITFAETAQHIYSMRDDREQVEALVDAVTGLTFDVDAKVERRLLYGGDDDPHVYKDGYAVWARYPEPGLPMVLYVPHELADDFEQTGRENWRGRGTIVGWDSLHGRLQVKVERPGRG